MALRKIEISFGQNFGLLTVIKEVDSVIYKKRKKRMILCKCECGQETTVRLEYLRNEHTKSCGCASVKALIKHRKTHGLTGTRLHGIWNGMKGRCYNKNRKSYKDYGAKGVRVCDEWHDFETFYVWAINNGYEEHLTIERKDPFGNYEPANCEWIPKAEQAKNKRIHAVKVDD
ncbi:hypothetical protein [Sutcliffiella halmapala]|uniref:hypothetical protein n=1 Tax=Sutcliffiella halmapala TaxID=79882 RepID=UPI0009949CF7|nr:hypothetical protein [Sutcliffiella halmapala]